MSVMFRTRATFILKENSSLVARIVLFDTAGLHLLTFRVLQPHPSAITLVDFSHVISH